MVRCVAHERFGCGLTRGTDARPSVGRNGRSGGGSRVVHPDLRCGPDVVGQPERAAARNRNSVDTQFRVPVSSLVPRLSDGTADGFVRDLVKVVNVSDAEDLASTVALAVVKLALVERAKTRSIKTIQNDLRICQPARDVIPERTYAITGRREVDMPSRMRRGSGGSGEAKREVNDSRHRMTQNGCGCLQADIDCIRSCACSVRLLVFRHALHPSMC